MKSLDSTSEAPGSATRRNLSGVANRLSETLDLHSGVVLAVFSGAYFALTFYRASRKLFWLDELFTLYMSRLPDLKSVWQALLNSVDFNPPILYVLTRFSEHLLGEGHIATRLPAIVGFWIFCICIFRYVSFRLSVLSACVSMLFPLVTGAYWYAYEARAHGIVLGFCGIALISWQRVADGAPRRGGWLLAMGASLTCALLTHSYAFLIFAPIVLGELSRTMSRKRLDWPVWTTIAVSSLAILVSLPLLHRATSEIGSRPFFAANLVKLIMLYVELLIPATGVLLGWLILLSSRKKNDNSPPNRNLGMRPHEMTALVAFLAIPLFAYVAARLTGAPFLSRYGLPTVAGFAGLLGVTVAKRPAIGIATLLLLVAQIGFAFLGFASDSVLAEPSSGFGISTRISGFNQRYDWMAEDTTLPIVLVDELEFVTTAYYAPSGVAPRLVYVVLPKSSRIIAEEYARLRACCKSDPATIGLADFVTSHDRFLVYGGTPYAGRLKDFADDGATVQVKRETRDHFLALVTYPKRPVKESSR